MDLRGGACALLVSAAAWGCGSSPIAPGFSDAGSNTPTDEAGDHTGIDGGSSASDGATGRFGDGSIADAGPGCAVEASYVYVVDLGGALYKFDPQALTLTGIGQIPCVGNQFFSMAVDRQAVAWVLAQNGALARYDIKTQACTVTSFASGQNGFTTFGMGFVADTKGGTSETLFVADGPQNSTLASIDTQSLSLSVVGKFDVPAFVAGAELTGTGDGRLFGAFYGTPFVVAEIDKTTAHIKSQVPQNPVTVPPGPTNFAFAFWGGSFYLFAGPGTRTDIYQYTPSGPTTTLVKSVPQVIVGAGVSTCAPTTPPQ